MTATLLASLVEDGVVALDNEIGRVLALISFAGSKRPLSLLVQFTSSGQIAILRALSPDEAAPW